MYHASLCTGNSGRDGEEGMRRQEQQEPSANGDIKGDGNTLSSGMSEDAKVSEGWIDD